MAITAETLTTILYLLMTWASVSTVTIFLARRDVILGLRKWWMIKRRMQPIKLRYHGPDHNVRTFVLSAKNSGETITIGDKKLVFFKTNSGQTFFFDEKAIRRGDDGINEISYNYKSIMPLFAHKSMEQAIRERKDEITRIKAAKAKDVADTALSGVEMEKLSKYTDPKRLNRLIEYVKLAAKTDAMLKNQEIEKYVKYTLYASLAAAGIAGLVWWTMDGKIIPMLSQIQDAVANVGSTVLNL